MKERKTITDFLNNHSTNPTLHKKVWRMSEVDWIDLYERTEDYQDASSGSVSGCIYYEDTVPFAKKNLGLILEQLRETEMEIGSLSVPDKYDSETQYYNWLTWFAWEQFVGEVTSYIESNY